jgi:hypothetical protein
MSIAIMAFYGSDRRKIKYKFSRPRLDFVDVGIWAGNLKVLIVLPFL